MSDQPSVRTRTPCVGICSTTYGDDVCRGCKRFIHEVINWNSFKPEEKEAVWKRLEHLKTLIMESKVTINNENLMESKILEFQLKINKDLNPLSKVFETPTLIVLATLVLPSSAILSFDVPDSVKSVALALTARAATPTDVNKILRMRSLPLLI